MNPVVIYIYITCAKGRKSLLMLSHFCRSPIKADEDHRVLNDPLKTEGDNRAHTNYVQLH